MKMLVEAAGSNMDCLLKVIVWLKDQRQQEEFDRIYRSYFTSTETLPARTRMQAGRTPMDCGARGRGDRLRAVGGRAMGTYIVLVNSTDKGAVNVREVPNRQQTSRDTAAKLGIVRKTVYMTLGPYDFVQIIEAPNDEAVAKYVLSINSKGNVRTTTMRAWDEAEHFEFLKAMP